MGYESKLDGALWLDPFPGTDDVPPLRAALAGLANPAAGRLALTPLGHGLVFEDTLDWTAALELLERARDTVLAPRGLVVGGTLRAIGEDDAHLATLSLDAGGIRVERHAEDPGGLSEKEAEWAQFCTDAEDEGLSAHIARLVELCVPSLRLVPQERSELRSRLGGLPDAPAGWVWPQVSTGEPLTFVAQLDLAEVHALAVPGAEALPERGLLSFFHGHEPSPDNNEHTGNAGRVLFFDAAAPLPPFACCSRSIRTPPATSTSATAACWPS